jgi:hypothetical protein
MMNPTPHTKPAMWQRIAVYCASNDGARPVYLEAARAMGTVLAEQGLTVVYGGGRVGLMGALADGAMAAGGEVFVAVPGNFQPSLMDQGRGLKGLSGLLVRHPDECELAHDRAKEGSRTRDAGRSAAGRADASEAKTGVQPRSRASCAASPCFGAAHAWAPRRGEDCGAAMPELARSLAERCS